MCIHYLYGSLIRMQVWPPNKSKRSQYNKTEFHDLNNWILSLYAFPKKMPEKSRCKVHAHLQDSKSSSRIYTITIYLKNSVYEQGENGAD